MQSSGDILHYLKKQVLAVLLLFVLLPSLAQASVDNVREIVITASPVIPNGIIQVAEIIAIDADTGLDVALLSAGATVTSSGVFQSRFAAENAIDGLDAPGADSASNFYHSVVAFNQFLTVRLASDFRLDEIQIVGRGDGSSYRDRYNVEFRDANGQTLLRELDVDATGDTHRAVVDDISDFSVDNVREIVVRSSQYTRSEILQISEIIAIDAQTGVDVALSSSGATAVSSGNFDAALNGGQGESATIDGMEEPGGGPNTPPLYHSVVAPDQFLTVRFPSERSLKSVDIVGRADWCCDRDLFDIELRNSAGATLFRSEFVDANNPEHRARVNLQPLAKSNIVGRWGEIIPWPLTAVSMANLPDGRILTYSGSERRSWPTTEQTYSATWDPADGSFSERLHTGHNMFCATLSMLDDGKVYVNGGRNFGNSPWTSTYDYQTNEWTQLDNMPTGGRWYPTTLTIGDGSVLTSMGAATNVRNPDLYLPDSTRRVLNGIDFIGLRTRRNEGGREDWFPLLSLAPNGDVFHYWDTVESHYISTVGNGTTRNANAVTDNPDHAGGAQVMYDEGKLLMSGVNQGSWKTTPYVSSDQAFTVDLNSATPQIRATSPMRFERMFHQLITLPTGEVLVVGGNTSAQAFSDVGAVHEPEIWNPETGAWRRVAPLTIPRNYHSTALLMADGRVIVNGGGYSPGDPNFIANHSDAQLYSPPYFYDENGNLAQRPTVSSTEDEVNYGQQFEVETTGDIDYFSLIRMSSTTHALNTDHRYFRPDFVSSGNGRYMISMHTNPNVATPGYWMLFAVDTRGAVSVSDVIRIADDVPFDPNNGQAPVVQPITTTAIQIGTSRFDVSASGIDLLYSWNFGDGSADSPFSTTSAIDHTYAAPGRYVVNVTVRTPAGEETIETFTQVVTGANNGERAKVAAALLEISEQQELWNVNPDNHSVTIIDTATLQRKAIVDVGSNPRALALAPDGRVWIVNKDDASVSILDAGNRSVQSTLLLDSASRPHGIVFNAHSAYITLEASSTVLQLDAFTGEEKRRLVVGNAPRHLSINADGDRLFVSDYITPVLSGEGGLTPDTQSGGGRIYVLDTDTNALTLADTWTLQHGTRLVTENQGPGLPNYLGPVLISPDGATAWIPSKQDNILGGELRGGDGMTFDQTVRAITSRINLATGVENVGARVDHDNASVASQGTYGPNGAIIFVSLEGNRQVALIDNFTNLEFARFDTRHAPQSLLLSADGRHLYVHNFLDRSVGVYNIEAVVNGRTTEVTETGVVATLGSERLSPAVLRGKQLFYDARDDRLAALNYMSCAACHNDGEGDGRVWDFSSLGEGLRNTNDLRGNGNTSGALHWSANFDEVQDFENAIRSFAGGTGLMRDEDFNQGSRSNPLGLSKKGLSEDLDALAAYVESLDVALASPHRDADGSLTATAQQGRALFSSRGCAACHGGASFTDSASGALHDVGTIKDHSGRRSGNVLTGIDTPSLLGVWNTAPYLHDGSADTLRDAILAHTTVSASEAATLAAYVEQIDSSEPPFTESTTTVPPVTTPTNPNAFSTPAAIVIDGDISDWPLTASVGVDPQDATGGGNELDYERGWLAHDAENLYIRYDNHAPNNTRLTWGYSVGVDVDGAVNGYTDDYLPIGVDYLLESDSIYRYNGDGNNWSWVWIANMPIEFRGRNAELSVARSLIGNPQTFDFFFYGNNAAIGGTAIDFFPDAVPDDSASLPTRFFSYDFAGTVPDPVDSTPTPVLANTEVFHNEVGGLVIDGNLGDWNSVEAFGEDRDDVAATTNVVDFLQTWAAHDNDNFYFAWVNDGPAEITWGNAIYVDTDLDASTGFRGFSNDAPIGIDFLIESDSVYRYSGNGNDWSWDFVGNSEVAVAGNNLELRLPASLLSDVQTIDLFFYGDSTSLGGVGTDFFPDVVSDENSPLEARRFRYSRNQTLARLRQESLIKRASQ